MAFPPARLVLLAIVAAAAALSACGGGGDGGGSPSTVTATLHSTPGVDGTIVMNGAPSGVSVTGTVIQVGDTPVLGTDLAVRGFLRFSRAAIPPGATLVSATLRLHQSFVFAGPYVTLGSLLVDHVDLGAGLDFTDATSAALSGSFGTLSSDAAIAYHTLDVTAQVAADIAASKPDTDFRLHMLVGADGDGTEDITQWDDGEDALGSGNVPQLVVVYQP